MRRAALVVAATLTLLGVVGPGRSAWAQGSGTPSSPLQVGIKPLDPFVTRSGDAYAGFSIELWDEIARRNGWSST
jgi:polar amino acid transport system substrate-binding protein